MFQVWLETSLSQNCRVGYLSPSGAWEGIGSRYSVNHHSLVCLCCQVKESADTNTTSLNASISLVLILKTVLVVIVSCSVIFTVNPCTFIMIVDLISMVVPHYILFFFFSSITKSFGFVILVGQSCIITGFISQVPAELL